MINWITKLALALGLFTSLTAHSYDPANRLVTGLEKPKELLGVGIKQKVGGSVDLDLEFVDDNGETIKLGKYFDKKPVLFTIIYFNCPSLCNYHLNGLTEALAKLEWTVGKEFELVALTMNHREDHKLAKLKKAAYVKDYGRPESADGWHLLTGTEDNIRKIANQVGFGFKWLPDQGDYAHASAAQVLTPGGKISRYLPGIEFEPQTVKLSLLEASNGKIGNVIDQILLYCLEFDPNKNKYTVVAFKVMQAGGFAVVLMMALILVPLWIRERKAIKKSQ